MPWTHRTFWKEDRKQFFVNVHLLKNFALIKQNWVSTFLLTTNGARKSKGTKAIICLKEKSKSTNSSTSEQQQKNLLTLKNKSSPKGKSDSIAGLFRQKKEERHKLLALFQHSVYKAFNAMLPCQLKVSIGFTFQF